jgi:hypothetical protein
MIGGYLRGGLGNMLFIIATIKYLAKKNNTSASFPNVKSHLSYIQKARLTVYPNSDVMVSDYLKIFKNFKWDSGGTFNKKIVCTFGYRKIQCTEGVIYHGYFQSEKYFNDRDYILNLFEPSDFVLQQIKKYKGILKGETCAIHVRRGDYSLNQESKHHTKSMGWYNSAMGIVNAEKYIIFSDDILYAKQNFVGDKFIFIEEKDYIELFLMSMCKHNIISSSSFSWWGAWLNKNKNKKVVAPLHWFGRNSNIEEHDIIPDNWIKL